MRTDVQPAVPEPPPPPDFKRLETPARRFERFATYLISILFIVGAIAAAFFWGRSTVEVPDIDATRVRIVTKVEKHQLTAEQLELFDRVYEFIGQRRPAKAEELLAAALEKEPSLPFASYLLGWIKYYRGKRVEALPLLDASVERGEAITPALLALAQTYRTKPGKVNLRDRYFREAMQSDPINYEPFYSYGEALRRQGRASEAVGRLKAALDRSVFDPSYLMVETKLAFARLEAGDESVVEELRAAVAEDPPRGHMLVAAAALAFRENNPDEGARLLERARKILPAHFFRMFIVDQAFALSRDQPAMKSLY